jgi:hypothetical protein
VIDFNKINRESMVMFLIRYSVNLLCGNHRGYVTMNECDKMIMIDDFGINERRHLIHCISCFEGLRKSLKNFSIVVNF